MFLPDTTAFLHKTLKMSFRYILLFTWFLIFYKGNAQENIDSLLNILDNTIDNRLEFQKNKNSEIDSLHNILRGTSLQEQKRRYSLFNKLNKSYQTFNYDSSQYYISCMYDIANELENRSLIAETKLALSESYVNAGIFIEARDTLSSINVLNLSDSLKIQYYYTFARVNFDIIDFYSGKYFADRYIKLGLSYLDSALVYCDTTKKEYYSLMGLKYLKSSKYQQAKVFYKTLFSRFNPSGHQYAIEACTNAFVYECLGKEGKQMEWLIYAAIQDLKIANKEYIALRILADRLFQKGDIARSSKYLDVSLKDAKSFGALQREYQIEQIKPMVEEAKLTIIQNQRNRLKWFAYSLILLIVIVFLMLIMLFVQFKKVKSFRNELQLSNNELKKINNQLREVNLIKEEYIVFFFKTNSDFLNKMEKYRQSIENKVRLNKIKEISNLITIKSIKRERENLFHVFDAAFLNIYPGFIEKYNNLFDEKDRNIANNSKYINVEMRIFALIRLGITDSNKIAQILNYSVNTINTYKTKIKNASIVPNDEFEQHILSIQSI